jgi:hypothetical protein
MHGHITQSLCHAPYAGRRIYYPARASTALLSLKAAHKTSDHNLIATASNRLVAPYLRASARRLCLSLRHRYCTGASKWHTAFRSIEISVIRRNTVSGRSAACPDCRALAAPGCGFNRWTQQIRLNPQPEPAIRWARVRAAEMGRTQTFDCESVAFDYSQTTSFRVRPAPATRRKLATVR